jgi:hypothetical protein
LPGIAAAGRLRIGFFLELSLKTSILFAIKCQKVLAKCAKGMYNASVILLNAHLCKIIRRHILCPIVFSRAL